ncbi:unnamed protein product [Rhizopus stolonifer]
MMEDDGQNREQSTRCLPRNYENAMWTRRKLWQPSTKGLIDYERLPEQQPSYTMTSDTFLRKEGTIKTCITSWKKLSALPSMVSLPAKNWMEMPKSSSPKPLDSQEYSDIWKTQKKTKKIRFSLPRLWKKSNKPDIKTLSLKAQQTNPLEDMGSSQEIREEVTNTRVTKEALFLGEAMDEDDCSIGGGESYKKDGTKGYQINLKSDYMFCVYNNDHRSQQTSRSFKPSTTRPTKPTPTTTTINNIIIANTININKSRKLSKTTENITLQYSSRWNPTWDQDYKLQFQTKPVPWKLKPIRLSQVDQEAVDGAVEKFKTAQVIERSPT